MFAVFFMSLPLLSAFCVVQKAGNKIVAAVHEKNNSCLNNGPVISD
jgi:hypothetical protein